MARKRKLDQSPSAGSGHASNLPQDAKPSEASLTRRRQKGGAATRIGRACDRCQHRKLACDPAPEGCPTCVKVDAWCTATDPLTGTPTYRGEFEYLERTVAKQRVQIEELLDKFRSLGEDIKPYQDDDPGTPQYLAWVQVKAAGDTRPWERDERQQNAAYPTGPQQVQNGYGTYYSANGALTPALSLPVHASSDNVPGLPDLRTGFSGENYLGVSASNPSLSSRQGSKLNVLGWEIDIAGFTSVDRDNADPSFGHDEPSYDRSYKSFIASAFGVNSKVEKLKLPSRKDALRHAYGYVHVINAFTPILHAPSFLELVQRLYDDLKFEPSPAETVMIHVMLASMFYQDANRNREDSQRQKMLQAASNMHYHLSLGHFAQLMAGHTLQDVQALTMICMHMRTFPKPEASWLVSSMAFSKAIELGLHRAVKAGTASSGSKSVLETEMRKRTFWVITVIYVTISGKLGRPMPIREEDYDVALPLAIDDELLREGGLDTTRRGKCGFLVGLEAMKVEPIFMDLYRYMYAAKRSPRDYTQFVATAERRIKSWEDQWPAEFHENEQLNCIFTEYLHLWKHEFRLLLHHPSLSLTKSVPVNDMNLRTCLSVSHDMLKHVKKLQPLKSLDTTWQSCAVYILAIQTSLYGHSQLKSELTPEKLDSLKSDMEQWLNIMDDIGGLLGTGQRFQNAIRDQINIGLSQLEQQVSAKATSSTPPKPKHESSIPETGDMRASQVGLIQRDNFQDANGYGPYADSGQANGYERSNGLAPPVADDHAHAQNMFSNMAAYAYPEPSNAHYAASAAIPSSYAASPYPIALATQALSSSYQSQLNPAVSGPMTGMYAPTASNYHYSTNYGPDSQSWLQYTQSIPSGIGPQDYNPARALLELGGGTDQNVNRINVRRASVAAYDANALSGGAGHQMWPYNLMDQNQNGT